VFRTAPSDSEFEALEGIARTLTASGWYRVVRRFQPRFQYAEADDAAKKTALFVDVETTGLDHASDAIIEFAAVPFRYGVEDGEIYDVGEGLSFLEDPGCPIPEAITELTGITEEMVRGRRINDACVEALLDEASLIIAHNALFDRRFVERRLPAFSAKPWACSRDEVQWHEHGCSGTKLEYILLNIAGEFYDGHRAVDDCRVGIHVLASRGPTGALPFAQLLTSARRSTCRIWAVGSPFESKDQLKARRYRWHDGSDGRPRAWYTDVSEPEVESELGWLEETVYAGRPHHCPIDRLTAMERYSVRG
jgi:DNA polymerase III subunit epsilon